MGSSSSSTRAPAHDQRASTTFCWLPPDSGRRRRVDRRGADRKLRDVRLASARSASKSSSGPRRHVAERRERDVRRDAHARDEPALAVLADVPHPGRDRVGRATCDAPRAPEHLELPSVAGSRPNSVLASRLRPAPTRPKTLTTSPSSTSRSTGLSRGGAREARRAQGDRPPRGRALALGGGLGHQRRRAPDHHPRELASSTSLVVTVSTSSPSRRTVTRSEISTISGEPVRDVDDRDALPRELADDLEQPCAPRDPRARTSARRAAARAASVDSAFASSTSWRSAMPSSATGARGSMSKPTRRRCRSRLRRRAPSSRPASRRSATGQRAMRTFSATEQLRHQAQLLVDDADPAIARPLGDPNGTSPSSSTLPASGDRAGEDLHQRRLARAVLAQQRVHLAGVDLEVDAGERLYARIGLRDAARRAAAVTHSQSCLIFVPVDRRAAAGSG